LTASFSLLDPALQANSHVAFRLFYGDISVALTPHHRLTMT